MLNYLANPTNFDRLAARVLPFLSVATLLVFATGLYLALIGSPPDYQQGESVRIMYVHVPAAIMSTAVYVVMAVASAGFLIWRHPLADIAARECAPLGAAFTLICLATGSLWGKPMWGAWWVWDARLTSVLVLFFLYIGYMALAQQVAHTERGKKACAVLALVGVANIPIIRYSVEWWNTLHQPASLLRAEGPAIDPAMLWPLSAMGAAFALLFATLLLLRMRSALLASKLRRAQLRA